MLLGHAEHETDIQRSISTWTANKYASSTTDAISSLNDLLSYSKGFFRVERRASKQRSDSRLSVSHKLYRQTTLRLLDTDSASTNWSTTVARELLVKRNSLFSTWQEADGCGVTVKSASIRFWSAHKIREVKASRNEGKTHYRKHQIKQDPLIQKLQDHISLKIQT